VPPALAFLAVAGTGFAVAGVAQLLIERRSPAKWSLLVLLFPGTYMALSYCGPEPLGLGLVLWGLVAWSKRRPDVALVLFAIAGLCRETMLLVPAALLLGELFQRRIRRAALLAATFAPYASWIAFVRVRVGAWPTDASHGRLGLPFVGVVDGLSQAKFESLPYAVLCLVFGGAALLFTRNDPLRIVIGMHLAFSAVIGEVVWMTWDGFGRVLLPLNALALVMIVGKVLGDPPQEARSRPLPSSQERWLATSPRHGLTGVVGPGAPSGGASK
jgi:hypothetical protein